MTSKELLKGLEVDVNRLIDVFAEEVQNGEPFTFGTFKNVWRSLRMAVLLVSAGSEDEIAGHIQDVFMCALDRLELPSPLKYGQHFGEMHKPRRRRQGPLERSSSLFTEILPSDQTPPKKNGRDVKQESEKSEDEDRFCDAFKEAPDFPKSDLQEFISFEERVAVIYTLYCVYKEQCLEPVVSIHLPADLLSILQQLLLQMQKHGIWDGLYIFQNLIRENAFVGDVLRRPPSFLSLPLESSASETGALRDLSFHLRTSLQDLSRVDRLERMCDDYSSLQQRWTASELGESLNAKKLMTFNGDVGKWLRNVTSQEHRQVHQGITGLTTKESSSKRQTPHKKAPQMTTAEKRKWRESLPKITISGDDSWGINAPGLPKMARVVMMRDRERHKIAERMREEVSVHKAREQSPHLSRELRSEVIYNACMELETSQPQSHPSVEGNRDLGFDDDDDNEYSDLAVLESKREEVDGDSSDPDTKLESCLRPRDTEQKEPTEEMGEEEFSSEDDEEMRQWRQELSILNKEISHTSESLMSKGL